jgi:hypothetical protein
LGSAVAAEGDRLGADAVAFEAGQDLGQLCPGFGGRKDLASQGLLADEHAEQRLRAPGSAGLSGRSVLGPVCHADLTMDHDHAAMAA